MEREILFRGKRLDNGEWVYGTPFFGKKESCKMICACAVHPEFEDEENVYYCEGYPVDPATVGRYTGITDNRDTKIFEGDIVLTPFFRFVVSFKEGCFGGIVGEGAYRGFSAMMSSIYGVGGKVIGNIHDTPELLQGAQL